MNDSSRFQPWSVFRHRRLRSLFPMGLVVLAMGCTGVNLLMPPWRAADAMIASLPEPQGAVLIDEVERVTGGWTQPCYGAYIERLYGTELGFDNVLAFYEENLPSDDWHRLERLSSPPMWASPTKQFALAVSPNVEATFISSESIDAGRKQFSTLYYLALSYSTNPDYCRGF